MHNRAPWPSPVEPAGPVPPDQTRRAGIKWKFVIIAGVAGGLLVIGALLALNSLSKGWNQGGAFGVPQDFPIYRNATLSGVKETISTSGTRVTATWEADAPLDTVTAYYAERSPMPPVNTRASNRGSAVATAAMPAAALATNMSIASLARWFPSPAAFSSSRIPARRPETPTRPDS